jgi:hypothetical protein
MVTLPSSLLGVAMSLALFGGIAIADTTEDQRPVLTGTVNVILGNAQGIVVLTDSQQTQSVNGRLSEGSTPAQKLFRLDDQTVCTIAGFGSVSLPHFPEFINSAAGILDRYTSELHKHSGWHSFREKLTSLAFLVELYLDGIENLQSLTPQQATASYGFQLILVGYDVDGTPKIDKLVVTSDVSASGISRPTVSILPEKVIGRELTHETAGIGAYVVENILDHPKQFAEEKEIGRYGTSLAADRGGSLTITELEALASSLAHHAAIVDQVADLPHFRFIHLVGGRDQVAVLEKGRIQRIDQQEFTTPPLRMNEFAMIMGTSIDGGGIAGVQLNNTRQGRIGLYLKMGFSGGLVDLDRGYFYGDEFVNAKLFYDGAVVGFENNKITDCELVLTPDADRNPAFVQELLTNYHWKHVQK